MTFLRDTGFSGAVADSSTVPRYILVRENMPVRGLGVDIPIIQRERLGTVRRSRQSKRFHLRVPGFDSRYGLVRKESVNALPKVVGFPRALRFSPTGKVDRMG